MSDELQAPSPSDATLSAIEDEMRATLRKAIPKIPEEALEHGIFRFRELRQEVLAPLPIQMTLPDDLELPEDLEQPVYEAISDNMQAVARMMREQLLYPLMVEMIRLELNLYMHQLEHGA